MKRSIAGVGVKGRTRVGPVGLTLALMVALWLPTPPADAAEPNIVVNGHLEQAYADQFSSLSYTRDQGGTFTGLLSVVEGDEWYYFGFQQNLSAKSNAYCSGGKGRDSECKQNFKALHNSDYISFEWGNLYVPVDIITSSSKGGVSTPSGYVGRVGTGDGGSLEGASAADVEGFSAMDYNMNVLGWVDTFDSPNFAGQPNHPYIYPSIAEVRIRKSAFPAGADPRAPRVVVHNSPEAAAPTFRAITISCPANTRSPAGQNVTLTVQVTENGVGKSGQPVLVLLTGPGSVVSVGGTAGNRGTTGTGGNAAVVLTSDTPGTTQVRAVLDLDNDGQWDQASEPTTEPTCPVIWDEIPPAINIVKTGPATAFYGDTITYTMTVTIPGNVALNNVSVSDPRCDAGTISAPTKTNGDTDDLLEQAEAWIYTCTHRILDSDPDPLPNTATARGTGGSPPREVTDTDDHVVDLTLIPPVITIEKDGPQRASLGETITYRMDVSIPVNVPLTNVQVTDPKCDEAPTLVSKNGGDNDSILEFGEVWKYTCPHKISNSDPSPLPNTATATGTGPRGEQVQDQDSHLVEIEALPRIKIEKNGPQKARVGDTITYSLEVTIPVDRPLHNVKVTDTKCDSDPKLQVKAGGDNDDVLELGEVWVYTCDHKVTENDIPNIHNVAEAEGRDDAGKKATDEDDHDVRVDEVERKVVVRPPAPSGRLPFTGSDPAGLLRMSILLLLAGTCALVLGRRTERTTRGRAKN